jgi:hypothetical protein
LPRPILGCQVDNFVGQFIARRAVTGRGDRRMVGVGMRMEKFIKVDMLGACCPKINMLVIILLLGEVVVQHWPKEWRQESIHNSD